MPAPVRILTGITPSGTPHLGNYAGAIRPAVAASRQPGTESFYFLADYHALIKVQDPARVQRSTLEIAATWLACGLDPDRVWFYRQSDVPEIPELCWLLTCVAGKGLLNRAHAYKAAVDANVEKGEDADAGVTAGLYMYPVLMAADILAFKANRVPVGRDQVQHIEMARDFAARFNHSYGEHLVLPEAVIEEQVATLPGLDGRKMSKSYDNTIPLFAPAAQLKKLIAGIVTDSRTPGEPKDPDSAHLFTLYRAFASEAQAAAMHAALREGLAWGEAKQALFELLDGHLAPMRERYELLIAKPADIEATLQAGAVKARAIATPLLRELRAAVGLRPLSLATAPAPKAKAAKVAQPSFKQYRESDGRFYFKLVQADGRVLLQGAGQASPKEAGALIARLKAEAAKLDHEVDTGLQLAGTVVGRLEQGVELAEVVQALAALAEEG
ncbi:tryptophan--tRNA ligase [Silanimonas sp.]|uniref:tryptophan--tRNA ligase n=1 Tax=Silanimonas sp. TaxID=1929290 RepID=UPI001BC6E47F|nr:tryptophan--tRNA ligase [Silanimonas sp.]MBS3895957.1 tryptophan--tRNA ligase [Silanimonas sp.]MBS3924597.1 tryptophan--tRNA ligase [Xanthomonadaceae bacterium]